MSDPSFKRGVVLCCRSVKSCQDQRPFSETKEQDTSPTSCQVRLSTHYTLHYTLHATRYTLHAPHYTLHTTHYTLHTTHYTLHTTHYTLHTPGDVYNRLCNRCHKLVFSIRLVSTVVPLFNEHSCIQAKVSLHWGCPLIRGTDILEWGWGGVVGGFSYGYEKCTVCMYSVLVKKRHGHGSIYLFFRYNISIFVLIRIICCK